MKVAILGATGHVARCALLALSHEKNAEFYLFSRSMGKLEAVCRGYDQGKVHCMAGYSEFPNHDYDVIFNGVGVWDTPGVDARQIFSATEYYDNMVIQYQLTHPGAVSIHISSGAVYGGDYEKPVDDGAVAVLPVNHVTKGDYYTAAKLNSEIKHRAHEELNIVDIRLFGFFSRYMSLGYRYLLSGIINSIKENRPFHAIRPDFYRDYIHMDDFAAVLLGIARQPHINTAIDIRSKEPISKDQMLEFFTEKYGLKTVVAGDEVAISRTGVKPFYYSKRENDIYTPVHTSLETLESEVRYFLER